MGMLSNFTTEAVNDVFIVTVNLQEATIEQASEFNKLLSDAIENGCQKILIEMSEVNFIDSTFLGALIVNFKKIYPITGKLILVGLKPIVNTMFLQTSLNKIFEISQSRAEALKNI